jgi:hypothetical protein
VGFCDDDGGIRVRKTTFSSAAVPLLDGISVSGSHASVSGHSREAGHCFQKEVGGSTEVVTNPESAPSLGACRPPAHASAAKGAFGTFSVRLTEISA